MQTRSSGSWWDGDYIPADTRRTRTYHACGETHKASTSDEFIRGYFDPDKQHNNGNELEVYIWLEGYRLPWGPWVTTNRHATTELDINKWKNHS